ncbi:MAG: hypothetical protein QOE54_5581 [Streptosporangiaceae bacterium]|nr:hypothetical protein [Streptosporangiaceae bacterium]MDX6433215.1 hypothetical protein [Streptosporangiaceae bacterium]
MDFDQAADELYGVSPEEFVATRDRLAGAARAGRDTGLARRIAALRRPTVSAWAVNLLARQAADQMDSLLKVGSGLRGAWSAGTGLAEWERHRNSAVAKAARAVRELAERAGHSLREPARREVEETLQAAMVDPEVAEEVRAGRLTRPRSHVGFAAPGRPAPGQAPPPGPAARRKRAEDPRIRLRRLQVEAEEAAQAAASLQDTQAEWAGQLDTGQQELDGITQAEERLRGELDALRRRREAAGRHLRVVRREHDNAARSAAEARHRADEARHRLEEAADPAEPG